MKRLEHQKEPIVFIRELCKDLPETEQLEAEENFRQLLYLTYRIACRIRREKEL